MVVEFFDNSVVLNCILNLDDEAGKRNKVFPLKLVTHMVISPSHLGLVGNELSQMAAGTQFCALVLDVQGTEK